MTRPKNPTTLFYVSFACVALIVGILAANILSAAVDTLIERANLNLSPTL